MQCYLYSVCFELLSSQFELELEFDVHLKYNDVHYNVYLHFHCNYIQYYHYYKMTITNSFRFIILILQKCNSNCIVFVVFIRIALPYKQTKAKYPYVCLFVSVGRPIVPGAGVRPADVRGRRRLRVRGRHGDTEAQPLLPADRGR